VHDVHVHVVPCLVVVEVVGEVDVVVVVVGEEGDLLDAVAEAPVVEVVPEIAAVGVVVPEIVVVEVVVPGTVVGAVPGIVVEEEVVPETVVGEVVLEIVVAAVGIVAGMADLGTVEGEEVDGPLQVVAVDNVKDSPQEGYDFDPELLLRLKLLTHTP